MLPRIPYCSLVYLLLVVLSSRVAQNMYARELIMALYAFTFIKKTNILHSNQWTFFSAL